MNHLVYLGGPIAGCSYEECTDWREYAKRELARDGIIGVSPMRYKDCLKGETVIGGNKRPLVENYQQHLISGKGINRRDRFDIRMCEILLMNLLKAKKVSIGSVLEIGWGSMLDKLIVTIMEKDNIHRHCMIEDCSDFTVESLNEGILIVKAMWVLNGYE